MALPDETDTEVLGVAQPDPEDFEDLEKIIFNLETRDGRQYTLLVAREEGTRLRLQADHEGEYEEILTPDGEIHDVRFFGAQAWEFIIFRDVLEGD